MTPMHSLSQRARWAGGQPIGYLMQKALAHPELISLAAGFVDQESLPVEATREALDALLSDARLARAALQYGTTAGYLPLRAAVLDDLVRGDGRPETESALSTDQVIMTSGSNQMLHLLAETLFDPGDIVLCAAPTYFVYLGLLKNLGVRAYSVAGDEDGLIPTAVEEALEQFDERGELARVKAIYVVSYYDNPSGATLSLERRAELVELAERWSRKRKLYVIEDAAYRGLRLDGPQLPSLRTFDTTGETVIYTQTFSKIYSPGIRVGWGLLPEALVEPILEQKGNIDFGSPNFDQYLLATLLERGLVEPQTEKLRQTYRVKRDAMLAALDANMKDLPGVRWMRPKGGMYVWLELPAQVATGPDGTLFDRAVNEGVLYVPGEYCYAGEGMPVARNRIRLSYGVQSPERITDGIARSSRAVEAVLEAARVG